MLITLAPTELRPTAGQPTPELDRTFITIFHATQVGVHYFYKLKFKRLIFLTGFINII